MFEEMTDEDLQSSITDMQNELRRRATIEAAEFNANAIKESYEIEMDKISSGYHSAKAEGDEIIWEEPTNAANVYPNGIQVTKDGKQYVSMISNNDVEPGGPAPTWFMFWSELIDEDDSHWRLGKTYEVDDIVDFSDGKQYICIQAHSSQPDWMPSVAHSLWEEFVEPDPEPEPEPEPGVLQWSVGTSYAVGDRVMYLGNEYRCTYAHAGANHWNPSIANTLWALV